MDSKIFSPSMLKTFCDCPLKFHFRYIRNVAAPQTDSPFLHGKNLHALAAYYLKKIKIEKFINKLTEPELVMWNNLKENEYFNLTTDEVETSIMTKISDFWVGGRIDALVHDSEEHYFILDYKTGSIPKNAETDFQTMIYLLACDKKLQKYNTLNFVYLDLKNNKTELIKLTDELKENYVNIIKETHSKVVKNNLKKLEDTTKCNYCEYNKICV